MRRCEWCGSSLAGLRVDARFDNPVCKAQAHNFTETHSKPFWQKYVSLRRTGRFRPLIQP